MNLLLDTHIAIWALLDSPKLLPSSRELIMDPDNSIYVSAVSTWEIMLMRRTHPENMNLTPAMFAESCKEAGFIPLSLQDKHILTADAFPPSVDGLKDPFDRLLLAQAKTENMSLLTHDRKLSLYQEHCVIVQ